MGFNCKLDDMDRVKRGNEKIKILVEWLAKFDYSTRPLIGLMMKVDHAGQGAFFQRLEKMNIIFRHKIGGTNKNIYSLSSTGNQLCSMYFPEIHIKEKRKSPSLVAISHSFNIQYVIANYLNKNSISEYKTEKQLMHLKLQRRPDAIVTIDNEKYAIEVEITKKAMQKIYYNYAGHLKNIRSGLYDRVIYLFNNQYTLDFYKKLNDELIWPVFDKSNTGGRLIQRKDSFNSELIKNMGVFEFKFDEMYKL